MAFHWQPDLSPALKNAGLSRFMVTTIPSTFYVSWSAIFINQFLKFPFVRLTKKVWNKWIINAPNRCMMVLSI